MKKTIHYINAVYEGDVVMGYPHGRGKITYSNGDSYDGQWNSSKFCGQGTYDYFVADEKYIGEFKNNNKHGKGTYFYADGSVYEGQWENDVQNGFGMYTNKDGDTYQGMWKDGQKSGEGTQILTKENWMIEGIWSDNSLNGPATVTYEDGSRKHVVFKNNKAVENHNIKPKSQDFIN